MTARKKLLPLPTKPQPRWHVGWVEIRRTLISMVFSSIAVGTAFVTKENINALWDKPGTAAGIGLIVAGVLKICHQAYSDNTKQ